MEGSGVVQGRNDNILVAILVFLDEQMNTKLIIVVAWSDQGAHTYVLTTLSMSGCLGSDLARELAIGWNRETNTCPMNIILSKVTN